MTYLGTVRNGKIELEPGADLPDGTPVRVELLADDKNPAIGLANEAVDSGIEDLATQHNHYIYGTPKT